MLDNAMATARVYYSNTQDITINQLAMGNIQDSLVTFVQCILTDLSGIAQHNFWAGRIKYQQLHVLS